MQLFKVETFSDFLKSQCQNLSHTDHTVQANFSLHYFVNIYVL